MIGQLHNRLFCAAQAKRALPLTTLLHQTWGLLLWSLKTQRTQWAYRVVSKEIAVRAGSLETETTEQTTRRDSRVSYRVTLWGEQDSWERAQLQGGARQHGST